MVQPMADVGAEASKTSPQRWWHWFVVYPTLAVSLIASTPQLISTAKSFSENIPADKLEAAERQNALWRKNLPCTSAPMDIFLSPQNLKVDATICNSGDVFVKIFTPDNEGRFYWVDVESLAAERPAKLSDRGLPSLITSAQAGQLRATPVQMQGTVICQRFLDTRALLRVVSTGNACFDEIVDTFTGFVMSRTPSMCRNQC